MLIATFALGVTVGVTGTIWAAFAWTAHRAKTAPTIPEPQAWPITNPEPDLEPSLWQPPAGMA